MVSKLGDNGHIMVDSTSLYITARGQNNMHQCFNIFLMFSKYFLIHNDKLNNGQTAAVYLIHVFVHLTLNF